MSAVPGKSTLVNETLRPILSRKLYRSLDRPLPYDSIEGIEHVDKLVVVDQSPIGRTPRSNPATYSNVFADIRKLFEMTPDAQVRGFAADASPSTSRAAAARRAAVRGCRPSR